MEHLLSSNTALLIIDVQQGFDDPKWGRRNNPDAEANISNLINLWRSKKRPVIHIQHCSVEPDSPLRPELTGCQFKPEAAPIEGEPIYLSKPVIAGTFPSDRWRGGERARRG